MGVGLREYAGALGGGGWVGRGWRAHAERLDAAGWLALLVPTDGVSKWIRVVVVSRFSRRPG